MRFRDPLIQLPRDGAGWPASAARRMVVVGVTTALITVIAAHAAAARTTTDSGATGSATNLSTAQDLPLSSLQGALRETNHQRAQQRQAQARRDVIANAQKAPGKVGSANVVFSAGLDVRQAAGVVSRGGFDLISAEVKVPVGPSGEVYTLWFNDFERFGGTLTEKLERAIGKARLRYFREANAAPEPRQTTLRELAGGAYRFYRMELAGTHAAFAALTADTSVLAILPDRDETKVEGFREYRRMLGNPKPSTASAPSVRLTQGDPARQGTPPGAPVVTNSGQRCTWQEGDGVLACQDAVPRTVSGDPAIDAVLPQAAGGHAAGTTKASPSSVADDSGPRSTAAPDSFLFTVCNDGPFNESCPNDATYRPHPDTNGAQAFGVVIYNFPAGNNYFYECYVIWVYDNTPDGAGGYWTTVCNVYVINTPAFTIGEAAWTSKWGSLQANFQTVGQDLIVSTTAFKAPQLPRCNVENAIATARCSRIQSNVTYVPDPGIEDELIIPNPACTGPRFGNSNDWNRGCFFPTVWASNLPGAFLDTTFEDAADPYNIAIGSAQPTQIVEGRTYASFAQFFSYNNNAVAGQRAHHAVSIDSRLEFTAACIAGGFSDAFCFFPVDSSRVSDRIPFV
jgi:hypothetical protein